MEITITLGGGLIKVKPDGRLLMSGTATRREGIAAMLIHSVMSAYSDTDFDLDRLFTKEDFDRHKIDMDSRIIRARWTKNGYIKRIGETEDQFKHANNVKEAMSRKGAFTCTVGVFNKIPKSRPSTRPPDMRDRTTAPKPIIPTDDADAPGASAYAVNYPTLKE